jgi:hypothetical protein
MKKSISVFDTSLTGIKSSIAGIKKSQTNIQTKTDALFTSIYDLYVSGPSHTDKMKLKQVTCEFLNVLPSKAQAQAFNDKIGGLMPWGFKYSGGKWYETKDDPKRVMSRDAFEDKKQKAAEKRKTAQEEAKLKREARTLDIAKSEAEVIRLQKLIDDAKPVKQADIKAEAAKLAKAEVTAIKEAGKQALHSAIDDKNRVVKALESKHASEVEELRANYACLQAAFTKLTKDFNELQGQLIEARKGK